MTTKKKRSGKEKVKGEFICGFLIGLNLGFLCKIVFGFDEFFVTVQR